MSTPQREGSNSDKYVCTACRNKIPVRDLETVFRSELTDFLVSPEEVSAHLAAAAEMIWERQKLIDAANAELKKLLGQENELFDLYHESLVPKSDFARRLKPLSERRAQIEEELPRLEAQRDVLKIGLVSNEEVLEDTKDLANRWPDLPWERRRQIVEAITDRLVIGKEGVEVALLQVPFGEGDKWDTYPRS